MGSPSTVRSTVPNPEQAAVPPTRDFDSTVPGFGRRSPDETPWVLSMSPTPGLPLPTPPTRPRNGPETRVEGRHLRPQVPEVQRGCDPVEEEIG